MESGIGRSRGRGRPSEPLSLPSKPLRRPKILDDTEDDQFSDMPSTQEGNHRLSVLGGDSLKIIQSLADRTRNLGLDASNLPRPEEVYSGSYALGQPSDIQPSVSSENSASKLNIHATPFTPRPPFNRLLSSFSDSSDRCPSRDGVATPGLELFSAENDYHPLVNYLTEVLTCVTIYPGRFERQASKLVNVLNKRVIPDVDILGTIVETIYSQSVIEANFRYNGARLCNVLCDRLDAKFEKVTFRSMLLQRLQIDHKRREELAKFEPEVLRGFALFLCEIYLNLEIRSSLGVPHRLIPLQRAIIETLYTLIANPDSENLRCACKCLKLSGTFLEDDERLHSSSLQPQMAALMDRLKQTAMDAVGISKDARLMMLNVLELRASDWGRSASSPVIQSDQSAMSFRSRTPSYSSSKYYKNGPTSYGADYGDQFDSYSETDLFGEAADQFDEDEIDFNFSSEEEDDGGMDDEMLKAFEEFKKGM